MNGPIDTAPAETERPRRSRSFRTVLAIVPALAFIGVLGLAVSKSGSHAEAGKSAPSFELPLLDGSGVLTDEDLRGQPVVIR
ncbi:hypothetical protein BH24ACT26_BH24ACT26_09000 [soil metagenome]